MENWYKPGPVQSHQMTDEERKHYAPKRKKASDTRSESDIETYQADTIFKIRKRMHYTCKKMRDIVKYSFYGACLTFWVVLAITLLCANR